MYFVNQKLFILFDWFHDLFNLSLLLKVTHVECIGFGDSNDFGLTISRCKTQSMCVESPAETAIPLKVEAFRCSSTTATPLLRNTQESCLITHSMYFTIAFGPSLQPFGYLVEAQRCVLSPMHQSLTFTVHHQSPAASGQTSHAACLVTYPHTQTT